MKVILHFLILEDLMNNKIWAKAGITIAGVLGATYITFLTAPFFVNPIINKYVPEITKSIKDMTGLNSNLEEVTLVTTPKLTAGLRVKKFELLEPNNNKILTADNFRVKMSLLPILARKIEVDVVQLENLSANILINKDGSFEVEKYFPQSSETEEAEPIQALPFGLKLSNHLPNITVGAYDVTLTDGIDKYVINGNKTEISDFILNKSIKVKASGNAVLKGREQFNYNVKVFNKIMPDMELNDLVFNPTENNTEKKEDVKIDIISILKGIYANNLTAKADANLIITNDGIKGYADLSNLSLINLPKSNLKLKFKDKNIDIDSNIYTAANEVSKLYGVVKTGKNTNIDINLKSKVELSNILKIVKDIALIFDIKDLQTLSANGRLDADFNIKSDLKTVKSNGYLKIPNADVYYGLYKIGVDKINADVSLANNNINIKNIGFTILNQPLKLYGTVTSDAVSELHLTANNLSLKGLLVAAGQAALMKDNQVNSGTVSMKADIQGKLDKISPVINLNLNNINIKNVPAATSIVAPATTVSITSDGKTFGGQAKSSNIRIINPCAKVSIPNINAQIKENEIVITQTPVTIEKIKTTVSGKITNYLTEKIGLNFVTTGDIKSTLTGDVNIAKQTLNLTYATTETSTIIIPMFDKSKMTFSGSIKIIDSMLNPVLKGNISIPSINIPEIPVSMTNTDIKLDGHILKGNGSVQKFTSGGIIAENLVGDFSLKGENFYLNNVKGNAFSGKVGGNIVYNITNAKTGVEFSGSGLNAERAIYGAAGIKNAISGTLGFNTKLSLIAADYDEMMKSLRGNLSFNIKNGSFGEVGRLDKYLQANNIMTNVILKSTMTSIINSIAVMDTAKFDYLDGKMTFKNGWAGINPMKSSGKLLAYYITGKYNLLNGTTNVVVLGRMDAQLVAKLGPLGQLSANKLLSYIPKFGTATAKVVEALTTNPKGENTSAIPALTSGSTSYEDFKVVFNGGLESKSSVKSFKWLTMVDMSAIEHKTLKDSVNDIKSSVGKDVTNTVNSTVNSVKDVVTSSKEQWNSTKEDWNATKDQFKNSAEEIKNLFKKKESTPAGSTAPATGVTVESAVTESSAAE